ncbi:cytochrome c biogenesis CcdA family protein [Mobilicoccus pelagius]|uniref:Putative thiol-disulfide oxidoreductase n=1 Tax=Mobilicoccus pelagius NBRC 104925 TaxID=1089455 RepID=H5UVX2_9MICO|nr:cytochrome c biogenesis CcdA family protein [Mobilicoccus pelagius]GAB49880.1 putative thiol-disulfide oxidoreductase [Mobilicoccus pelagius NBRC 104925]
MTDIGYAVALLGGVATILSPCAAMLLPAFFAYAFTSATTLVGRTFLFYTGLLTTLVPLGALSGGIGAALLAQRSWLILAAAAVVVLLGLAQMLALPMPGLTRRGSADSASPVAIYTLGLAYGVAGVCSGPILGSVLTVAALGGNAFYGAMLLVVYATGMVVPVLLLALGWTRLDLASARWLRPRPVQLGRVSTTIGNLVSGGLFVAVGLLLMATEGTASMGGILGVDAQQRLEERMLTLGRGIPDVAVVALVVALFTLAALVAHRARTSGTRGTAAHSGTY